MTIRVGAYYAKSRLSELLDRVEAGERIIITRHGRPVAELVPARGAPQRTVASAIEELRELRRGRRLCPGESIRDLIDEGRRR